MKEFFKKIWVWVLKNKVVSIVITSVVTVGLVCAIVLPITLKHKHDFGTELQHDATSHYYACECGAKKDNEEHDFNTTLQSNATHHWLECECGEKKDETAHDFGTELQHDATSHYYA